MPKNQHVPAEPSADPAEKLLAERVIFADQLQDLLTENDKLRAVAAQLETERARREHLEAELEAVYQTKTFRATSWLRKGRAHKRGADTR